ncbi:hypothetical protein CRM22_007578 [Opisthorchis felineus]|uniref:Uncharacterized protein n=1 Tax=Opisthorchis felineus TaxID=147828 RepID=A0A4S2LF79_OPIFE|nr:hypothetical protein CRM22_007578 [Opisthorchis felineus]
MPTSTFPNNPSNYPGGALGLLTVRTADTLTNLPAQSYQTNELENPVTPGAIANHSLFLSTSYNRGEMSAILKRANAVVIYRDGEDAEPQNYRPPILVCIQLKYFSRISRGRVSKQLPSTLPASLW